MYIYILLITVILIGVQKHIMYIVYVKRNEMITLRLLFTDSPTYSKQLYKFHSWKETLSFGRKPCDKKPFKECFAHERRMLIMSFFLGNKNGKKTERRWKTGGMRRAQWKREAKQTGREEVA